MAGLFDIATALVSNSASITVEGVRLEQVRYTSSCPTDRRSQPQEKKEMTHKGEITIECSRLLKQKG